MKELNLHTENARRIHCVNYKCIVVNCLSFIFIKQNLDFFIKNNLQALKATHLQREEIR